MNAYDNQAPEEGDVTVAITLTAVFALILGAVTFAILYWLAPRLGFPPLGFTTALVTGMIVMTVVAVAGLMASVRDVR